MKVAIYTRVSTEEQDADKQEYICKEYCERNNWKVYKVYKDIWSGAKDSRPSFNKLIEDMREFKFQGIVVTKLDRLGRSLQHLLSLIDEFNRKKIKFIAATQNIDTSTSMGNLQLQIMGAFAEYERNIISERTKEGLRRAIGVGKRGKDKTPRKRRTDKIKRNIQIKSFSYSRVCIRCGNKYKTPRYSSKVCKNCRGGIKSQ